MYWRKWTLKTGLFHILINASEMIGYNDHWRNNCFVHSDCTVTAPVFGRHQFFGTSEHYGKAHGSLLSGWMNYNYTACCWFPTSSNILILPSQFWQIRFESYWLHSSKCRILVLLRYFSQVSFDFDNPCLTTLLVLNVIYLFKGIMLQTRFTVQKGSYIQ